MTSENYETDLCFANPYCAASRSAAISTPEGASDEQDSVTERLLENRKVSILLLHDTTR
jgi:hypothetical protein